MTVTWTVIVFWLALQLPLATLIGKSIRFGMREPPSVIVARRRMVPSSLRGAKKRVSATIVQLARKDVSKAVRTKAMNVKSGAKKCWLAMRSMARSQPTVVRRPRRSKRNFGFLTR
jgi:hypothetical protein